MTIDKHSAVALLAPIGVTLGDKEITVSLDEGRAPYCEVQLTARLPDPVDRDLVDLRESAIRLDLRLRQDFGAPWSLADLTDDIGGSMAALTALLAGDPLGALTNRYYEPWNGATVRPARRRFFDLYVTDREFDDVTKELRITATSDESLLLRDALVATSPWSPGSMSVKTIVQLVLDRYDALLDPDSLDATVAEVDATDWQPGVTAWAYLDTLLEPASLKLWCDEARVWRITDRQPTQPGAVTITPTGTMTGHTDRMTYDPEVWFDAVLVEYRWTDEFDLNRVEWDVAGASPAKSVLVEHRTTAYPGPGAAAGILNRAQGRGRLLDVAAVSDYTLTPGMAATITPPETDAQTGYLAAVKWQLPAGEMDVTTRGLVDTPETAYLYGPTGASYLDVPVGVDYTEFDWSMV